MITMVKKELIKAIKPRYLKANKKEKNKILNKFCSNTGYHRKYAIRILQAGFNNSKIKDIGRKQRKRIYGSVVMAVVIKIWELLEYPCGLRLKPSLLSMVKVLERHKEIVVDNATKKKLKKISSKTIDRRLGKERKLRRLKRNRGTTRHGSLLKSSIPIKITNWDIHEVGFMEMDTVSHNGGDPAGEFISSLDLVEIYSGWSEQYAVMGKGKKGIINAVDNIKQIIPFVLKGLDSDGGSEFINWHMVNYCANNNLGFTRSRPNRSNDNAYVEQKNYTHIRKWLGYRRYATQEQLRLINNLYRNELRLFNNFFRPVMKIESKEKVNNSVCKKKYDLAQAPYQRLIDSKQISAGKKKELKKLYLSLNPVQLRKVIDDKIKKIKAS